MNWLSAGLITSVIGTISTVGFYYYWYKPRKYAYWTSYLDSLTIPYTFYYDSPTTREEAMTRFTDIKNQMVSGAFSDSDKILMNQIDISPLLLLETDCIYIFFKSKMTERNPMPFVKIVNAVRMIPSRNRVLFSNN